MASPTEKPLPPDSSLDKPIRGCLLGGFVASGLVVYPAALLTCWLPNSLLFAVAVHFGLLFFHRVALWIQNDNRIEGTVALAMALLLILLSIPAINKVREETERERQEQQQGPPAKGAGR
jgi:hypothetical protein